MSADAVVDLSSAAEVSGGRGAGGGTEGFVVGAPLTSWLRRASEGILVEVGRKGGVEVWIKVVPWTKVSGVDEGGGGSIRGAVAA